MNAPALSSIVLLLAGLVAGLPVLAQGTELTPVQQRERQQLIEQAQAQHQQGHHAVALSLAEQAGRMRMTPSLRALLALELQAVGRLVDGAEMAQRCVDEVEADTQVPNRDTLLGLCRARLDEVSARVGRVVVRIRRPAPHGLRVLFQDAVLPEERWGRVSWVLPGTVVIEALAPGRSAFRREAQVAAGGSIEVQVACPAPEIPEHAAAAAAVRVAAPLHDRREAPRGAGLMAGPLVTMGAGVALLGTGVVLGVLRNAALDDLRGACGNLLDCPSSARPTYQRATDLNLWANVTLVAGGVVTAAGLAWQLIGLLVRRRTVDAPVRPTLSLDGTAGLEGRF